MSTQVNETDLNHLEVPIHLWKWKGLAGHFICASKCAFKLCTVIGEFVVSSVGAMYVERNGKHVLETIGYARHYETQVFFKLNDDTIDLDLGIAFMDGLYIGDDKLNSDFTWDAKAEKMHMDMCLKVASLSREEVETLRQQAKDCGGFY